MIYKKIPLDPSDESVYLEAYIADKSEHFVRSAILVIPGGAYSMVCADREGEPVAMAFMPYGFNAFVLHYSVGKGPFPKQLIEASAAMKHIRDNAEEYGINPEKVFAVGFSAGGHLAASLGTMWNLKEIYDKIPMETGYNKPTGMMLIYPVITDNEGTFHNLFCTKQPTEEQAKIFDITNHTDASSSPAFIVHTSNDMGVPVHNALDLAAKLAEVGAEFELHIYPDSPHGMALANEITAYSNPDHIRPRYARWVEEAVGWAEEITK